LQTALHTRSRPITSAAASAAAAVKAVAGRQDSVQPAAQALAAHLNECLSKRLAVQRSATLMDNRV
jgi:hypothetical protein